VRTAQRAPADGSSRSHADDCGDRGERVGDVVVAVLVSHGDWTPRSARRTFSGITVSSHAKQQGRQRPREASGDAGVAPTRGRQEARPPTHPAPGPCPSRSGTSWDGGSGDGEALRPRRPSTHRSVLMGVHVVFAHNPPPHPGSRLGGRRSGGPITMHRQSDNGVGHLDEYHRRTSR